VDPDGVLVAGAFTKFVAGAFAADAACDEFAASGAACGACGAVDAKLVPLRWNR
jgi:cytochrome c551/c552